MPDVDIITGGSPCQDLSVVGKGAGLNGARSGLFFHFINLIKEKQPMYFVWENVKGAFSSSKGWDFARVQIEMEQAGYDVWWQLINAKDFGVPQNRERIFAIGIRKGSGREILFERIGSSQDIKTQQQVSSTIHAGYYKQGGRDQQYVTQKGNARAVSTVGSQHPMYAVDITRRAKTGYKLRKENNVGTITSTYYKGIGNAERPGVIVHNLQPRSQVAEVKAIKYGQNNPDRNGNTSDEMFTLKSGSSHAGVLQDMRIRRLTPTECERLMGLEDGWTSKGIIDGKEVDISDTQRYKMCGNGVVVNCVDYIYSLIKQ